MTGCLHREAEEARHRALRVRGGGAARARGQGARARWAAGGVQALWAHVGMP